jgi:hypothetical protein
MAGSRALRGIANGLVDTFVSRNNDVSGYWGIGQIQHELEGLAIAVAELDLLNGDAVPDGPVGRALIAHYSGYLAEKLGKSRLGPLDVTEAKVIVEFGAFGEAASYDHLGIPGAPFNCKVLLAGRNGRVYSAMRAGRSRPHDPGREQRSLRFR